MAHSLSHIKNLYTNSLSSSFHTLSVQLNYSERDWVFSLNQLRNELVELVESCNEDIEFGVNKYFGSLWLQWQRRDYIKEAQGWNPAQY